MATKKEDFDRFLNKLSNDNGDKKQFFYPNNLAEGFTYPDVVRIGIVEKPGIAISEISEGAKGLFRALLGDSGENKEQPTNKTVDEAVIAGQEAANLVLEKGNVFSKQVIEARNFIKKRVNAPEKQIASIYLPMPENVTFSETADWQTAEIGSLMAAATGKAGSSDDIENLLKHGVGAAGTILGGGAGALVSKVLGGGLLGGAVLGTLSGASGLQSGIETTVKLTTNPFKEQAFKGIPFRPFEFAWTFSARNFNEVGKVKDIINLIRQHSRPEYEGDDKLLFKYPHYYTITFLTKLSGEGTLSRNEYLPRLKTCVLKSINTNFATAGWHSFEAGAPTSITLQLGFEEIDIITHNDIKDKEF